MRVSWMLNRLAIFLMHLLFVRSHGEEQSIFLLLLIHSLSLLIAITTDAAHQSARDQRSAAARGGINPHRCRLDSAKVTRTQARASSNYLRQTVLAAWGRRAHAGYPHRGYSVTVQPGKTRKEGEAEIRKCSVGKRGKSPGISSAHFSIYGPPRFSSRHGSGERRGRRGLLVEEAGRWYQGDVWVQGGARDVSNFCFGFDTRLEPNTDENLP